MPDSVSEGVSSGNNNRPFSFAVKNGNQELLERLNQGLNIIKSTGQYDAIYKKWFGALEDSKLQWKTVLKYGSVVVLILFGFIVWNVMLNRQVKAKTVHLEAEIAERKQAEEELRFQSEIMSNIPIMRTNVPEKLLAIVEEIELYGNANLTRLTVLKKWFNTPERLSDFGI